MVKMGKARTLPAIMSIAMAGFVLPVASLWAQGAPTSVAEAQFSLADLRQKSDEELTQMLANLEQYNASERRALFTHVRSRMHLNERYQRKMRGRVGSVYGQRLIRRADGSLVLQRRVVKQRKVYMPPSQSGPTVSTEVVSGSDTFGHGFEKRSRARRPAQITIQATTRLSRPPSHPISTVSTADSQSDTPSP